MNVKRVLIAFVVAAALLVPAAVAWACVPQATVSAQPASGASGTQTTVSGQEWASMPVEIRWDSASGPMLTTVQGPSFSVAVTVPQAADGHHLVVAVQRFSDHDWVVAAPFEVRSTPAPPPPGPTVMPPASGGAALTPTQPRRRGRCSRLRGKRRSRCIRRSCGKKRGAKRRACVRKVTRRR
jgi:hypothetical protein